MNLTLSRLLVDIRLSGYHVRLYTGGTYECKKKTLKMNNNQHFKCVLLDFDSNLGRVSLKPAFSLS